MDRKFVEASEALEGCLKAFWTIELLKGEVKDLALMQRKKSDVRERASRT